MARTHGGGRGLNEALKVISQGTITQSWTVSATQDFVSGTETQISGVSAVLLASAEDEVLNWLKIHWIIIPQGENQVVYQWWLIRQKTTDSLPNFDSANFEYDRLIRDHAVLARSKTIVFEASLYDRPVSQQIEKFNVRLKKGEELRLVVRPLTNNTDVFQYLHVEYRKAGRVAA